MITEPRAEEITLPEVSHIDFFDAALNQARKISDSVCDEIASIANNDEDEINRIKRAFEWVLYHQCLEKGVDIERRPKPQDEKEPSNIEKALSTVLVMLSLLGDDIESGNLPEVFNILGNSSEVFGMAISIKHAENQKMLEKAIFYKNAAMKRHAENHAIKADAIKYYVDNIDSFKSKDNAAEQIAGKVVPASFRAVRKWISEYHKKLRSTGTT